MNSETKTIFDGPEYWPHLIDEFDAVDSLGECWPVDKERLSVRLELLMDYLKKLDSSNANKLAAFAFETGVAFSVAQARCEISSKGGRPSINLTDAQQRKFIDEYCRERDSNVSQTAAATRAGAKIGLSPGTSRKLHKRMALEAKYVFGSIPLEPEK